MKNILIIDDQSGLSNSLVCSLNREKYDVLEAVDEEETLAMIMHKRGANEVFSLLIVDINEPEINGLTILEKLQRKNISIKTLVINNSFKSNLIHRLATMNVSRYFQKPFTKEKLSKKSKQYWKNYKEVITEEFCYGQILV